MRLQLDFNRKILKVEGQVSLNEFINKVQTLLEDWEDWRLEATIEISNFTNPFIINSPGTSNYPWYNTPVTTGTTTNTSSFKNKVYNLIIEENE